MSDWSTAYVNSMPDSHFLYVRPGGRTERMGGRVYTIPRSLRMFPYKNKEGHIDRDHLANARARLAQSHTDLSEAKREQLYRKAGDLYEKHFGYEGERTPFEKNAPRKRRRGAMVPEDTVVIGPIIIREASVQMHRFLSLARTGFIEEAASIDSGKPRPAEPPPWPTEGFGVVHGGIIMGLTALVQTYDIPEWFDDAIWGVNDGMPPEYYQYGAALARLTLTERRRGVPMVQLHRGKHSKIEIHFVEEDRKR